MIDAKEFLGITRDVIDQQLKDRSNDAVCEIESVNDDGTLNIYILPDRVNVVRNIINESRYNFRSGDAALLYLIKNRISDSFVIAKFKPSDEDIRSSGNSQSVVVSGVPGPQGPPGPQGEPGLSADVVQETGESTTAVMSQKATTDEINQIKEVPIRKGTGSNSLIGNDLINNKSISQNTSSFGSKNLTGLKGYYYSTIDFTTKIITLATAHVEGIELNSCDYEVGNYLNIVNDVKYDNCCQITSINGGKITVDNLPFSSIVSGDTDVEAYTISSPDNPEIGLVDLGFSSVSFGDNNKSINGYAFSSGRLNTNIGQYSFTSGYRNKAGYGTLVSGRDNSWTGQAGACFGEKNLGNSNKGFTAGYNNNHGDNNYTFSIGSNNTLNATQEWSIGSNNTLNGAYNISVGTNNISANRNVINIGYGNNANSEGNATSDSTISIGSNNTVTRKHSFAAGRSISLNHYASTGLGIGLTSTASYQTLLGGYNNTTGMSEETAIRVTGAGTSLSAKKTVETLSKSGDLKLAGTTITLDAASSLPVTSTGGPVEVNAQLLRNLKVIANNYDNDINSKFNKTGGEINGSVSISGNLSVNGNAITGLPATINEIGLVKPDNNTISVNQDGVLSVISVPQATTSVIGGLRLGFESTDAKHAVEIDENGKAYVQIPVITQLITSVDTSEFEVTDGNLSLKEISVSKLSQSENEILILNSGGSVV